jgi:regulator of nucleoside diphosphate kinase
MEAAIKQIYVTDHDHRRLMQVVPSQSALRNTDKIHLQGLRRALEAAVIVAPEAIPPYIITMNSRFRLKELETAHEAEYTLVFPGKADIRRGMISILAPAGASLIGARELETVYVQTPAGEKQFSVGSITYQPEAAEEYGL